MDVEGKEDLEAMNAGIPAMNTKLVMKKIMKMKSKFLVQSFSVQRSDFNKCWVNISFSFYII